MIDGNKTRVFYLRGNHDDFLDQVLPLEIGRLSILKDMVYESHGRRYFITHGDVFDNITTNLRWIAYLGDVGYTFLLWINTQVNLYRRKKSLPYFSLSQYVKSKVKSAVTYIDDFERELCKIARSKNCDGIICGHIHKAEIRNIDGIDYYNSGDWVETLSALAEDHDGNWQLIYYNELDFSQLNNNKVINIKEIAVNQAKNYY
jgi:UDP-2,3-diacylglucosamine pyrophosphatase LpxH